MPQYVFVGECRAELQSKIIIIKYNDVWDVMMLEQGLKSLYCYGLCVCRSNDVLCDSSPLYWKFCPNNVARTLRLYCRSHESCCDKIKTIYHYKSSINTEIFISRFKPLIWIRRHRRENIGNRRQHCNIVV